MLKKILKICCAILIFWSHGTYASELPHDGHLRLYHSHSQEYLDIEYEKNGQLVPGTMEQINHFMRSREDGLVTSMDSDLIRLLDHIQDHFKTDTLEVICGYRSPSFNKSLKNKGHNVARESYHMKGLAADIHIDEIPEEVLKNYVWSLNQGGVGYYPDLLMVHVDLGIHRQWTEDRFTNRLNIGEFHSEVPVQLKTDKLFLFDGDIQQLSLQAEGVPLKETLFLEHFTRGQWQGLQSIPLTLKIRLNELNLPYGKFRWKLESRDGRVQYSNEFYLKRKK